MSGLIWCSGLCGAFDLWEVVVELYSLVMVMGGTVFFGLVS